MVRMAVTASDTVWPAVSIALPPSRETMATLRNSNMPPAMRKGSTTQRTRAKRQDAVKAMTRAQVMEPTPSSSVPMASLATPLTCAASVDRRVDKRPTLFSGRSKKDCGWRRIALKAMVRRRRVRRSPRYEKTVMRQRTPRNAQVPSRKNQPRYWSAFSFMTSSLGMKNVSIMPADKIHRGLECTQEGGCCVRCYPRRAQYIHVQLANALTSVDD